MTCRDSGDFMMRYFDGETNDIETAQLKQHLKTCKKCSEEYENLKEVFSFLETDIEIEPPQDFEASVMSRINVLELERKMKTERALFILYGAATAVLAALSIFFIIEIKDMIFRAMEHAGGNSGVTYVLYGFLRKLNGLADKGADVLIQVGIVINNLYYYILAVGALLLLMAKPNSIGIGKNMEISAARNANKK